MEEDGGEAEEKTFMQAEAGSTDKQIINLRKEPTNETCTCIARFAVLSLTVLAVILLIALLVCTVRWRDVRNAAMTRREQRACVNSSQLANQDSACPGGLQPQDGSCCGDVSRVVDALLKQTSKTKFQDTVSASEGTMVFWNEASPETILQGFHYQDGSIFINKTGHYYVYSQIKVTKTTDFHLQTQNTADVHAMSGNNPGNKHPGYTTTTKHPFFCHNLYRHSKTTDLQRQILLESSRSDCSVSSEDNTVTSSFGAVFNLVAGDTVHVETSHPQHLVDGPHSNFFGLYSV